MNLNTNDIMKIISSFTDFYEFDAYRYGEPDQRLVWVRNTESFEIKGHHDKNEMNQFNSKLEYDEFIALTNSLFLPESYCNDRNYYGKDVKQNIFVIYESLIGIYPYVYYCPQLYRREYYQRNYFGLKGTYVCKNGYESNETIFPLAITSNEYKAKYGIMPKIEELCPNIGSIDGPSLLFPKEKKGYYTLSYFHSGKRRINEDPFKIECKRLFEILKVPIFNIYKKDSTMRNQQLITIVEKNPNLLETPLLKAYPDIQAEQDVYNDIENFLWEHKQEPISEPSNDLKIQAAGFDKKTSFRKM